MTYKPTQPILDAIKKGLLVERYPLVVRGDQARHLFTPPYVANALDGLDERLRSFPMTEMEKQISIFASGYLMVGSLIGSSKKKPTFEKLNDLNEVWAFCARKPLAGQVRMLGRFADKGVFIGLGLYDRGFLGSPANYHAVAEQIPSKWIDVFGSFQPLKGQNLEDYLGGVVRDVDQPED